MTREELDKIQDCFLELDNLKKHLDKCNEAFTQEDSYFNNLQVILKKQYIPHGFFEEYLDNLNKGILELEKELTDARIIK